FVSRVSGVLQVARPLDYEAQRWHNLTVRVRDPVIGVYADALVIVAVTDVNDNAPRFPAPVLRAAVSEAAVPGTVVARVKASDADTGDNGRLRYRCVRGCSLFTVAGTGGEVVLIGDLDADGGGDEPVQHELLVSATDTGLPPLNTTVTIVVTVEDFNDNAPVWASAAFATAVSPDVAVGQAVTAVRAADPDKSDGGRLRYDIVADDGGLPTFVVHPTSGVVSVVSPQRLADVTSLVLNVSVTDGVHVVFASLNVTVTPTNNRPPKFSRALYEARVAESAAPDSAVASVEAADGDPGPYGSLVYSILGDDHRSVFSIDQDGTLRTVVELDREVQSSYLVVVSATDGGGKTDFTRVRVLVDDVNDNAPLFALPQYQANVRVDTAVGDTILKVVARDADDGANGAVSYALYEANASLALHMFDIDARLGVVHLKQSALGQANEVYQFFVRASDAGHPEHHSDVPVSVFLLPPSHASPRCPASFRRFFLLEDAALGTVVTTLWQGGPMPVQYWLVTDGAPADEGSLTADKASLTADETAQFSVSPSGDVILNRMLDHETRRSHEVIVVNQTLTSPPTLDYMTIQVVVMDVNDNAPEFGSSVYEVQAAEDAAVGATLLIVTASDQDAGTNAQITYALSPSTPATVSRLVHVTPETGVVRLIAPLDRETNERLSFVVLASDGGASSLSASATVVITVIDCNDNPPVFSNPVYYASVSEDAQPGAVVLLLPLSDADEDQQQNLDFFTDGNDAALFYIDPTGQVRVAGSLDRETHPTHRLSVTVSDGTFSANCSLTVSVVDVNDNGPVCPTSEMHVSVSEAAPPGEALLVIEASDADASPNDVSRFALSGAGSELFALDERTGELTTAAPLDRETTDTFLLTVRVSDWLVPEWHCDVLVVVAVTDENDNPPLLLEGQYSATVPEDAPLNTVITKLHATDPDLGDGGLVHYRLLDSEEGHFVLDEREGLVSLARPLDREERNRYTLVFEVSDGGTPPLHSTSTLLITVSDINDNPPEFVRTLLQASVKENTAVGAEVARVMATSRDVGINAEITYSIQPSSLSAYLRIDPNTGVISVAKELDFEALQSVVVSVRATDGGTPPLSSTALLNLTVLDTNDNAPAFTQQSYTGRVSEGAPLGEYIVQLAAQDADSGDNGRVAYSISRGNDAGHFAVNAKTGALTLARRVDREAAVQHSLEVTVSDRGSPSLSASVPVTVTVGDINDNAPLFDQPSYAAIVQEDKKLGYPVLRLRVTDADGVGNASPFTWEVTDVTSNPNLLTGLNVFAVDQDGVVRLATMGLDHKVISEYMLHIRVYDSGTPALSSDTTVNITVVERSKFAPTVFPVHVTVFSYRSAYKGGVIGKVNAIDKDPYDTLLYSIVPFSKAGRRYGDEDYFDVDAEDGTLVAVTPLDAGTYRLNISVSDGKFQRSVIASIEVRIFTQAMVDSSVIVRLGSMSPEVFIARYKKALISSIASELYLSESQIVLISLQTVVHERLERRRRETNEGLDALLVLQKNNQEYFTRLETITSLAKSLPRIKRKLSLDHLSIMESLCRNKEQCSGNGDCIDVVVVKDESLMPLNTRVESVVPLRFEHNSGCICHQGFGGDNCNDLVNACGHRPCFEYQVCTPTDLIPKGHLCHCKIGFSGSQCEVDVSRCDSLSCYHPVRPLSFRGKSYAQYEGVGVNEESSFQLSLFLRTRHPYGVLMHVAGTIDFSTLEVLDGYLQYRWECGSGEGVVTFAKFKISDNGWHFINVTRKGTLSVLSVDHQEVSSVAPGDSDVLNLLSDTLYLGAKISGDHSHTQAISRGFIGCVDEITLNGHSLPLSLVTTGSGATKLKRFVNIELTCPATLPAPGICGSHPCLNGGTCTEINKTQYECSCTDRYSGKQCELDGAPCSDSPCLNDGECLVVGNSYSCSCPVRLSGKRCEYGTFCNPNPCLNGGRCEEGSRGPICKCRNFAGERCERDVDECKQMPCQNGGTCLNYHGGFRCLCPSVASGEFCTELDARGESGINIALEDLLVIVPVVLLFVLTVAFILLWQRRRWRRKNLQRSNRVRLTSHVKNDLKSDLRPHRNSKLCNVEADQLNMQYPTMRPRSLISSEDESLKQWTEAPQNTQDAFEMDVLSHPGDGARKIPPDAASGDPNMDKNLDRSNPSYVKLVAQGDGNLYLADPSNVQHKPWNHNYNLNDPQYSFIKGEMYVPVPLSPHTCSPVAAAAVPKNSRSHYAPTDEIGESKLSAAHRLDPSFLQSHETTNPGHPEQPSPGCLESPAHGSSQNHPSSKSFKHVTPKSENVHFFPLSKSSVCCKESSPNCQSQECVSQVSKKDVFKQRISIPLLRKSQIKKPLLQSSSNDKDECPASDEKMTECDINTANFGSHTNLLSFSIKERKPNYECISFSSPSSPALHNLPIEFPSCDNLLLATETRPYDVMTKSDFSANSEYRYSDSACDSEMDSSLQVGSLQSSVYEKRLSELCATEDVIYRAPSRDRISQLNINRRGICFKDSQDGACLLQFQNDLDEDQVNCEDSNDSVGHLMTKQVSILAAEYPAEGVGGRPVTPLTTFRGADQSAGRAQQLDVARRGDDDDDGGEVRPLLQYTSQALPEVVLCSQDSQAAAAAADHPAGSSLTNAPEAYNYSGNLRIGHEMVTVSDAQELYPSTTSSLNSLRQNLPNNVLQISGDVSRGSNSPSMYRVSSDNEFSNNVSSPPANNISLDSSDDAINETPVPNSIKLLGVNMPYNIVSDELPHVKISNTSSSDLTLPSIPKIRNDRNMRTHPRLRNGRDDAASGARMGNPRRRRPIVRGDYGRVSDLSFATDDDVGRNSDYETSDLENDRIMSQTEKL
ncbi:fat-like cadherin-related tumor suppressor homolog, partial [Hyalella azteca]|uniref:Fat-like cadherin-related tumor suppressor homolog n=1 Tax=Hyalella azteca TaxID=294128 RepID=A0A979FQH9_HYAAZ